MGIFNKKTETKQEEIQLKQLVMNEILFDATLRGEIILGKNTNMHTIFEFIDKQDNGFLIENNQFLIDSSELIDFKYEDVGEIIAENYCNIKLIRNIDRFNSISTPFTIGIVVDCDGKRKYRALWKREEFKHPLQISVTPRYKGKEDDFFLYYYGIVPGYDYSAYHLEEQEKKIREENNGKTF